MNMILKTEKVIKDWTDYNGHLNVAFYVHIFDIAADIMLDNFKMGGESAKKDKKTTFVAEMYTAYKQEVRLGEEVETHLTYVDHDKKRIHYRLSMYHKEKKYLAATNEVLSLYVDLEKRKVIEFDSDRKILMDDCIKKNSSKFSTDKLIFLNKLKKI
jgi:acyl-CoA thioester hydrolase